MAEITWRNINAPDFTPVARLQESGANLINLGMGTINNTLGQYRDMQNINFNTQKERNTGNAINQLVSLGSLGDYDAAVQSGQFSPEQLQERFGAAVDTNAIAKQLSARRGDLIRDESGELSLAQAQREQAAQPLRDEILKYIAAGDMQSAANVYAANSDKLTGSTDLASMFMNQRNQDRQFALDNQRLALARAAANKKDSPSASAMKSAKTDAFGQYVQERWNQDIAAGRDPNERKSEFLKVANQYGIDAKDATSKIGDVENLFAKNMDIPAQAYDQVIKPIEGMIDDLSTAKDNQLKKDLNTLGVSSSAYEAVNLGGKNSDIKTKGDLINGLFNEGIFDNDKADIRNAAEAVLKENPNLSLDGVSHILKNSAQQGGIYFGNDVIKIDKDLAVKQAKQAKDIQSNPATMNRIKELENINNKRFSTDIRKLEDAKRNATLEVRRSMYTGQPIQPVNVPVPNYSDYNQGRYPVEEINDAVRFLLKSTQ